MLHGAVSYHFLGKQELLVKAALHAFEQAVPIAEFEVLAKLSERYDEAVAFGIIRNRLRDRQDGDHPG